jgi:hypothetical protein
MVYKSECWRGKDGMVVQEGEDVDFDDQVKNENMQKYLLYGAIAFSVYWFVIRKK